MNKETKFKVGDKAWKPKGYKFPCTIVGVFETIKGDIRVVGEMDDYGLFVAPCYVKKRTSERLFKKTKACIVLEDHMRVIQEPSSSTLPY